MAKVDTGSFILILAIITLFVFLFFCMVDKCSNVLAEKLVETSATIISK